MMIIRRVFQVLSWIALALTIVPSMMLLCGYGGMTHEKMQAIMLGATIGWFIVTPVWMGREKPKPKQSETLP